MDLKKILSESSTIIADKYISKTNYSLNFEIHLQQQKETNIQLLFQFCN